MFGEGLEYFQVNYSRDYTLLPIWGKGTTLKAVFGKLNEREVEVICIYEWIPIRKETTCAVLSKTPWNVIIIYIDKGTFLVVIT